MSSPIHAMISGTFTSDGANRSLSLPSGYDKFEMYNITDIGSAAAATPVMYAQTISQAAQGSYLRNLKTNGAATWAITSMDTVNGFTFIADSGSTTLGAPIAGTAITAANPAIVSVPSTANLFAGDVVRLTNTTGMLQIAGMDFTINTVVANTSFALPFLDASGFAAPATAARVQKVPFPSRYYPRNRYITKITQATSAVIQMSVTHGLTVGQEVRILVPPEFGMVEMNNLLGTITAVNTALATNGNTITVNIDSSGFTAFAFPTSLIASGGVIFPQVVPVGEAAVNTLALPVANSLDDATVNQSFTGILIGTDVQTTGKLYQWFAYKTTAI